MRVGLSLFHVPRPRLSVGTPRGRDVVYVRLSPPCVAPPVMPKAHLVKVVGFSYTHIHRRWYSVSLTLHQSSSNGTLSLFGENFCLTHPSYCDLQ